MYGFVVDNSGQPIEDAEIEIDSDDFFSGENAVTRLISTTTDAAGFYDIDVVRNTGEIFTHTIKYTQGTSTEEKTDQITIPDSDSAAVSDNLYSAA